MVGKRMIAYCQITMRHTVLLSGTNNLKSVQFFKLVLGYDYSIVLYRTEENFGDQKVLRIYNYGFLAKNILANQ